MRCRSSSLIIRSFAFMRSRRLFRRSWNLPAAGLPAMKVKPRKSKVSGLPSPSRWRRSAAKRPNSINRVFSGCSDNANSRQPLAHLVQEAPGVDLVLESDDKVVGIAHDDHIARGLAPSPARGPEVEGVVQVDVGKQR